jgi:hypothetical protein
VEFEPLDDFEEKLKRSFVRWPAPPSLKHRLMQNRRRRKEHPRWFALPREVLVAVWMCVFAGVFTALYAGIASDHAEQQRKEEEARRQVLLALRITNHALNHMNQQLAAHHHFRQN